MLNWFLVYSIVLSFLYRIHYHRKVIAPNNGGVIKWVAATYIRCLCVTAIVFLGHANGILGIGYQAWWEKYTVDHSMILWWMTVIPITAGLYIAKEATFYVFRDPAHYKWFEGETPSLHKIDMSLPLIWNTAFWGWMLFCPWLPFFSCLLRIFLLNTSAHVVFPWSDL